MRLPCLWKPLANLIQDLMIKLKVVSHWQLLDKFFGQNYFIKCREKAFFSC